MRQRLGGREPACSRLMPSGMQVPAVGRIVVTVGVGCARRGATRAAIIRRVQRRSRDAVFAGLVAAAASGIPSTAWTLARGGDVLQGARAAGALVLPGQRDARLQLLAAVPVHLALS